MSRTVSHLALTPTDKGLSITCDDRDPAAGNMSHEYTVATVYSHPDGTAYEHTFAKLDFQHGPVKEAGINGITNEALIAIVIDRLQGAQEGQFKCHENALAITALEEASLWLAKRTLDRMGRGVEGQSKA